jgi:hypothetical protein
MNRSRWRVRTKSSADTFIELHAPFRRSERRPLVQGRSPMILTPPVFCYLRSERESQRSSGSSSAVVVLALLANGQGSRCPHHHGQLLPTKRQRSGHGWRGGHTIMCISRQHQPPGSIRSNAGLLSLPARSCGAASILQPASSKLTSAHSSSDTTRTQTLQVDQVRRQDPLSRQALLPKGRTGFMWRTLDSRD